MKIMIVDDEAIVQIAFKSLVDWQGMGCEVLTASNGQEALDKCRRDTPDILVTDIRMPVMDGLVLLKHLSEEFPQIVTFALTAFDDFPYVKQAFRLGVTDYLLKSEMNEQVLTELYQKSLSKLAGSPDSVAPTPDPLREDLLRDFLSRHIFSEEGDSRSLRKDGSATGYGFPTRRVGCIVVAIQRYNEILSRYEKGGLSLYQRSVVSCISEALSFDDSPLVQPINLRQYFILLSLPRDAASPGAFLAKVAGSIRMRIGDSLNLGVDIGMDYLPEMELPQLPALYRNALSALDSVFFRKNDQPVLYAGPLPVSDETLYASEYTEGFRQLLQSSPSDPDGLSALLIPPEKGTSFGKDAILRLYTRYFYLLSIHIPESDEIPQIRLLLDRFSTSLAAEIPLCELNSQLTELVNRVLEYSRKPVNYLVDRAQSFVRRNFSKAITLSSVASELCVSEEHLSRLFTETTGESFSHFLTSVRIDYAAELLRSGKYRIYEVSEMAGYSSTEHFSRVFKSRTGMTPRQYMNHTPQ